MNAKVIWAGVHEVRALTTYHHYERVLSLSLPLPSILPWYVPNVRIKRCALLFLLWCSSIFFVRPPLLSLHSVIEINSIASLIPKQQKKKESKLINSMIGRDFDDSILSLFYPSFLPFTVFVHRWKIKLFWHRIVLTTRIICFNTWTNRRCSYASSNFESVYQEIGWKTKYNENGMAYKN